MGPGRPFGGVAAAPAVVLFVGLAGWRAAVDRGAHPGWQPPAPGFGEVATYVMPSTSGLNAATSLDELAVRMRRRTPPPAGA